MLLTDPRRRGGLALLLLSGCLLGGPRAHAEDLQWNGFFTTGTAFSDSSERYNADILKKPELAPSTRLGLSVGQDISPSIRVGAQFLMQEADADAALKADWAFASFRLMQGLHLTVGKQKVPMWLTSAYIDVGAAYPWARPPEEVYTLFDLRSFTGASLRFERPLGPTVLALEPYGGETFIETQPSAPTGGSKITGKNFFGATAEWTWEATTLRGSYNRGRWNLNIGDGLELGERHLIIRSLGFSTKLAGFFLMAEQGELIDQDEGKFLGKADDLNAEAATDAAGGDKAGAAAAAGQAALYGLKVGGAKGDYVTAGYKYQAFGVHLTRAELHHEVLPGVTQNQRSVALGTSWDTSNDSVLKLEAKRISIPEGSIGLFNTPGWSDELDGTMVYAANYNLIF